MHSDSWGSLTEGAYDSLAADIDIFTWNNKVSGLYHKLVATSAGRLSDQAFQCCDQDFLPVVAAGNFGTQEVDSTVSSPSTAKNCLSVGEPHTVG